MRCNASIILRCKQIIYKSKYLCLNILVLIEKSAYLQSDLYLSGKGQNACAYCVTEAAAPQIHFFINKIACVF